jgi:hypothetical protein
VARSTVAPAALERQYAARGGRFAMRRSQRALETRSTISVEHLFGTETPAEKGYCRLGTETSAELSPMAAANVANKSSK